ncbi:MAG TPA: type II toxin-antitoxin system Phd/YefM family antitoxin [Acidimicrobiales bacterium]|nr:type II toxin-antitoxin system Phd/YefM family antitoxin [Acidimicrobiales bacterium]
MADTSTAGTLTATQSKADSYAQVAGDTTRVGEAHQLVRAQNRDDRTPSVRSDDVRATLVGTMTSMSTVSIRDLANNASAVVDEVATSGRPAVVTKHGKPVAAVVPIDQAALEDWVLANAPEFVANMAEADEEIAKGIRGKPLGEVLAELDQ